MNVAAVAEPVLIIQDVYTSLRLELCTYTFTYLQEKFNGQDKSHIQAPFLLTNWNKYPWS